MLSAALLDRWFAMRDQLLTSPRFHRFASRFALTKPTARKHAQGLFDLCAGFVYSQVLFACVRLKVFDALAKGAKSADELALTFDLSPQALETLMQAAISLKLVEARGPHHYGLGVYGAAMLANPSIAAMVEHHAMLYADLADPLALLRGELPATKLAGYWPYAAKPDGETRGAVLAEPKVAPYTALMAASQALIAEDVLDAYALAGHQCLMDVGGGDGTFLNFAAARAPELSLKLFDLPAIAATAKANFERAGLAGRAQAHGGDFLSDSLPLGADVISLIRIVHDHDDASVLKLFKAVRAALPPQGVLLIAEPMSGTPGAERIADAYFGFYLLAMGNGRPRSADAIAALLKLAGFGEIASVPTRRPFLTRLICASP